MNSIGTKGEDKNAFAALNNRSLPSVGQEKVTSRGKKSEDVIIYHLKSDLFMKQKQNEILG